MQLNEKGKIAQHPLDVGYLDGCGFPKGKKKAKKKRSGQARSGQLPSPERSRASQASRWQSRSG